MKAIEVINKGGRWEPRGGAKVEDWKPLLKIFKVAKLADKANGREIWKLWGTLREFKKGDIPLTFMVWSPEAEAKAAEAHNKAMEMEEFKARALKELKG